MSESKIGDVAWLDLTVDDASTVRDFYQKVVGWKVEECNMGDYSDYSMLSPIDGTAKAGVCHARGGNADLPAVWLPYFLVENVDESLAAVLAMGGKEVTPIKSMGRDRYLVIKDPAGAACALYESASAQ